MAPAELTARMKPLIDMRLLRPWRTFACVLIMLWALTALAAGLGELPHLIGRRLQLHPHSTPSAGAALATWAHNMRIAGWPLLAIALRMHRQRWRRQLGDVFFAASLAANSVLVGAAIAAGGRELLPYLPHLPFEWAAMALSATGWLIASRTPMPQRQLAALAIVFAVLLGVAAVLETYCVPHL